MDVFLQMLDTDLVVDAIQTPFKQAPKPFYGVSMAHTPYIFLCTMVNCSVNVTLTKSLKRLGGITHNAGPFLNVFFNQKFNHVSFNLCDVLRLPGATSTHPLGYTEVDGCTCIFSAKLLITRIVKSSATSTVTLN